MTGDSDETMAVPVMDAILASYYSGKLQLFNDKGRPSVPLDKPLILLVDDDHAVKHLISEALEIENFRVITAENGIDALKLIDAHPFDGLLVYGGERLI